MNKRIFQVLCSLAFMVLPVFPSFAANTVTPKTTENAAAASTSGRAASAMPTADGSPDHVVASQPRDLVVALDGSGEPHEAGAWPIAPTGGQSQLSLLLIGIIIAVGSGLLGMALLALRMGKRVAQAAENVTMVASKVERLLQQIESLRATASTAAERNEEAMRRTVSTAVERNEEAMRRPASTPQVESNAGTDPLSTWARGPEALSQPMMPQPRGFFLLQAARDLTDNLNRLLSSPGFRSGDYDSAIAQFGSIHGVQVTTAGQARLVGLADDSSRRLVAVVLADEDVAVILPSSRYAKDFSMTYKESLEAGADVKALFECTIDGTAALKIGGVCVGRVDAEMGLDQIQRGELSGFVR